MFIGDDANSLAAVGDDIVGVAVSSLASSFDPRLMVKKSSAVYHQPASSYFPTLFKNIVQGDKRVQNDGLLL